MGLQRINIKLTSCPSTFYLKFAMSLSAQQQAGVREFVLQNVTKNPDTISALTREKFGLSRTSFSNYMRDLVRDGLIIASGNTYARRYQLAKIVDINFTLGLYVGQSEDAIWRFRILPQIKNVKQNVIDICQYGFTEMLNNAIDHSASKDAIIDYEQTYTTISMAIIDHGVGVFDKIQRDFGLADAREALLELSKGKLTSDKTKHSGEGIFFTSRMFDEFSIRSGYLFYSRERTMSDGWDWFVETEDRPKYEIGTAVTMEISTSANWTMSEVYNRYQNEDGGFRKTHVPVKIGKYPGEQLVSRSQAKRILSRFEKFSEVLLDFDGVPEIGQPFADEIFRVYNKDHPGVRVIAIRANPDVQRMIDQVRAAASDEEANAIT